MYMFLQACIDQKKMADPKHVVESLAVLPVYLSGCKRLLVFAGATYTSRLWCVLELFTFLRMGALRSAITLLPLATDAEALEESETGGLVIDQRVMSETLKAFGRFDVRQTRCTVQGDQDRLLTVIESGFGDHATFNALVRQTFSEGNVDDGADEAAQRHTGDSAMEAAEPTASLATAAVASASLATAAVAGPFATPVPDKIHVWQHARDRKPWRGKSITSLVPRAPSQVAPSATSKSQPQDITLTDA